MNEPQSAVVDPVDRRKYTRLAKRYDVEFSIVRLPEDALGLDGQKGHTMDVSRGGLCLETLEVDYTIFKYLHEHNVFLNILVMVPGEARPIKLVGKAAWFQEISEGHYRIGIAFRSISRTALKQLLALPTVGGWKKVCTVIIVDFLLSTFGLIIAGILGLLLILRIWFG